FCLARTRLGVVVVVPSYARRQRHENRFYPAPGLEAEQRAAVVNQVEFDVAAAAEFLKLPLAVAECLVLAPAGDRQVGVEEAGAAVADERERPFRVAFQVVEENSADAARLVAVLQKEILVTPLFEAAVVGRHGVAFADTLPDPVEMH